MGHSAKSVKRLIHPAAATAFACGCPRRAAILPGKPPKTTTATTTTAKRTANTTNAKMSKTSIVTIDSIMACGRYKYQSPTQILHLRSAPAERVRSLTFRDVALLDRLH